MLIWLDGITNNMFQIDGVNSKVWKIGQKDNKLKKCVLKDKNKSNCKIKILINRKIKSKNKRKYWQEKKKN